MTSKETYAKELKEIKAVFDSMNQEFWLIGGVLLGHVRDGDFIDWDNDMDVGMKLPCPEVPEAEQRAWFEKWAEPFRKAGFQVIVSSPKLYFGWIVALYKTIKTDIMVMEEYGGDLRYGYTHVAHDYPKRLFENMDTIKIGDCEYNIPTPVDEFLHTKFGEWRVPKAKIVEKRKSLPKSEYLELYDKKLAWRDNRECIQAGANLRDNMNTYFRRVVYIAGCWDLFHYGHASMLKRAAKLGHKLIVGVATDEYYERYKGKPPTIGYERRRAIINGIKGVYATIPHDEKESIDVYDNFNITTMVIGSDYTDTPSHKERIEEAEKRNIEIITLRTTSGISSTEIKEGIKSEWGRVF